MNKDRIVGIREASEQLGVSVNTLYSWIHLRKIEYVKIGRLVKFKQSSIDDLIRENTVPLKDSKCLI